MAKLRAGIFELHNADVVLLKNHLLKDKGRSAEEVQRLLGNTSAWLWSHPAVRRKTRPPPAMKAKLAEMRTWLKQAAANDPAFLHDQVDRVFDSLIALANQGALSGVLELLAWRWPPC